MDMFGMVSRIEKQNEMSSTYLGRGGPQSSPVDAGQDIDQKLRVDLDIIFGQLGLLGVQRERVVGRLAVLDRAGQKVECHDLHLDDFWLNIIFRF